MYWIGIGMGGGVCSEAEKVWALRLIREARVDLSLAQQTKSLNEARDLLLMTLRKAELAVSHALGYSEYLDFAVDEAVDAGVGASKPSVRIILKIREAARRLAALEHVYSKEAMLELGESILESAIHIVETTVN
ncbi:MAG: hypothetical protein QXN62_01465 [Candidatus Bathyarchaeia archaeon]|nr:hypothetical protein [Candidatus Bathyarchaeota archaeon]